MCSMVSRLPGWRGVLSRQLVSSVTTAASATQRRSTEPAGARAAKIRPGWASSHCYICRREVLCGARRIGETSYRFAQNVHRCSLQTPLAEEKGSGEAEAARERPERQTEEFLSAALSSNKCIVLRSPLDTPGGFQRREQIRRGHPWIYDFEIANIRFFTKGQTGQLLPVYDNDSTPLSLYFLRQQPTLQQMLLKERTGEAYCIMGLFSRQASVAVRMMMRSDTISGSTSTSTAGKTALGPLLRSRFFDALRLRGLSLNQQTPPSNSENSSASATSNSPSSNSLRKAAQSVWRALDGEADGLPGVELDVYGSVSLRAADYSSEAAALRIHSQALMPHIPQLVSLVEETINPETLCLQRLQSKKEKLAQGGTEYHSELLRGLDPEVWVENIGSAGVRLPVHLYLPPYAAFAAHLTPLLPLLRRICAGGSLLTVDASMRAIGVPCLRGVGAKEKRTEEDLSGSLFDDMQWQDGADSLVMIETSETTNMLNERAAAANGVMAAVSCIYADDAAKELASMKSSGLRFRGVYVHFHPKVRYAASERGGQFGRWFRPCLRGIESQWTAAARLVEKGGVLLTSLLLPIQQSSWALRGLRAAAEAAGRNASLIYTSAAAPSARLLTVQEDLWREQVFCVQLR